jgi:MFS family permease
MGTLEKEIAKVSAQVRREPPTLFRWIVLVFISLAMFGNYYIYDCISPLADVLKTQLHFSNSNIGLLNAIYSIPNVFMVLIGGFIIDRIGTKKGVLLFGIICLMGATLTASTGYLPVMAAGRLLFGLGAESLIVAVTTAIAKWFRGKELSFAFGVNLTIARLGSFAALNSPTWAKALYGHWRLPLLVAVGFGVICVVGAILYIILEKSAEGRYDLGKGSETDKVKLKDIFSFGTSYWFIVALCVTFYAAMFPFQTFAVDFFMSAHGTSREQGGFLSSMLTLFAMICTPLFGLLVDRVGRRSLFMMFGSLLIIPVYLIMGYTHVSLYVPMSIMGVAFSLIPAVMWPSVAYIVKQEKLGTAYGLMTMIQNIGLAGANLVIGWANDFSGASASNPAGYHLGMWIFSCCGFFGLLFAFLLRRSETGPHAHGLETIRAGQKNPTE